MHSSGWARFFKTEKYKMILFIQINKEKCPIKDKRAISMNPPKIRKINLRPTSKYHFFLIKLIILVIINEYWFRRIFN